MTKHENDDCVDSLAASAFHRVSSFGNFPEPIEPFNFPINMSKDMGFTSDSQIFFEPDEGMQLNCSLSDAIKGRRSTRKYGNKKLTMQEISQLLYSGFGVVKNQSGVVKETDKRICPSAGALFPVSPVVYIHNNTALDQGVYILDVEKYTLYKRPDINVPNNLNDWFKTTSIDYETIAAIIFFVGHWGLSCAKYGARGYRFVLLECGHIAQNISLVATALGIPHVLIGGFDDTLVNQALLLDGDGKAVVYSIVIGCK